MNCATLPGTVSVHIHASATRAIVCCGAATLDATAARHVQELSPAGAGQAWKFGDVCECPTHPDHHIHYSFVKEPTQEGTPMSTMYCSKDSTHSRVEKLPGRAVLMCTDLTPAQALVHVARGFPNLTRGHDWVIVSTEQCPSHATHKHFLMAARAKTESAAIAGCYDAPPPSVWDEESPPEMAPMQDPLQPVPDMAKDPDRAETLLVSVMRLTTVVQQKAAELAEAMTHSQRVDAAVQIATAAQILLYNTVRDMQGALAPDTLHLADPAMDPATQMRAIVTGEKWLATLTPEQVRASSAWTRKLFELIEEKMEKKRAQWKQTEKITVIKHVRTITGWGLKESKDFVDRHMPGSLV